ncbi:MAG TPA: hypothetical protein VLA74_14045 [Nitrososphaeraceae archaeon]|nr:hypothetical protein [Nitrososphaeraceae archaeon]
MDITKMYLLALLSAKDIERTVGSNIDYAMKGILEYIGMNPSSSTYDCHKYLNNIGMKLPYENVEEQIHNLIKLGRIQKVTNLDKKNKNSIEEDDESIIREKPKNNTIYYSISSAGIFYLFKTNPEAIDIEFILANKEDGLFVNFLYPLLDFNTLEKIEHSRTIMHITRLLARSCETIQTELKTLRNIEKNGGEAHTLGYVKGLANQEYDDGFYGPRGFLQGLKNSSKIKWIDIDNTKIIEVKKEKLFKICDNKNNELMLEICPERNVAILSDKNHKIKEFNLEKDPSGTYAITYFNPVMLEDYSDERFNNYGFYFYYELYKYEKEFCNSMLKYMQNEYNIMNKEERMIKRQDCIAIAKDKNFQEIARHYKQEFDSRYQSFIKLSNVQQI